MYDHSDDHGKSNGKRDDLKLEARTFATSGAGALEGNGGNPVLANTPFTQLTCWGLCPSMGTYTC